MTVYGLGRLTADPEVRVSQNGNAICKFTLASQRKFKREGQPDADFISCMAYGKTAEFIDKYFSKGMKMFVEHGTWETGSFTGKDGNKVYTNTLIVDSIDFAESKSSERQEAPKMDADGFMSMNDGLGDTELPFV